MNRSDSEEMAGRLLAAGCEESPSLDAADLDRHQHLRDPRGARAEGHRPAGPPRAAQGGEPGLRVVLTGCAVREPDADGLRRAIPAVDLFLRPDEEPELVDRLGLASAQAPVGIARRRDDDRSGGRRRRGGPPAGDACRRGGERRRPSRVGHRRLAADHLRLRQDLHLLHRAVQPRARSAAGPFDEIVDEAARSPPPASARSRCWART
jgi:hypothetical protein